MGEEEGEFDEEEGEYDMDGRVFPWAPAGTAQEPGFAFRGFSFAWVLFIARILRLLQVQNPVQRCETASVINAGALCAPSAESRTPPGDCEREAFRSARFGKYLKPALA